MKYEIFPDLFALTAIFEGMQDAVLTFNLEYRILNCNSAVKKVLGYEPTALLGETIFQIIPPALREQQAHLFQSILDGVAVAPVQTFRITADGKQLPVSLIMSPIRDKKGHIIGSSQIIRDITDVLESEKTASRLAAIIEGSEDAIVSKTLEGIINSWNPAAERMFGYFSHEVIGKSIAIIIPKERLAEEDMILKSIRAGKKIENFETIRQSKDGQLLPISLSVSPIRDHHGVVVGVSKIARNILTKKIAEERQSKLASIVESSDDAIISKTLEGIITSWNRSAVKIFGYEEHEAIGKHISLIIPEDRLEEESNILNNVREGNKIDHHLTVRKKKDGSLVTVSLTISPVKDGLGKVIGASKVARDITKEQEGNETMRQYAAKLQILNSTAKTFSEKLDVQNILQKVTDASTQLVGATFGAFFYNVIDQRGESDMLYAFSGASGEKLGVPLNMTDFRATFSEEGVVRVDDINKDPQYVQLAPHFFMSKEKLPVTSYLAVPVFSGSGAVIGGLSFGHPEAGKFTLEHEDLVVNMASQAGVALDNSVLFEQVRDLSQKKDEFIALATHELKTPLTSASGYLQLVKKRLENDPVNFPFLEKSVGQLNKLTILINDLFDVAKIQAGKIVLRYELIDLGELVKEIIEDYVEGSSHNFILSSEDGICLEGDRIRLEQVVTNFINNAVKYDSSEGFINIAIKEIGEKVHFSVQDEGIGINKVDQKHIFDQFYRASDHSQRISGLGLGLYISKEIIERHNGSVEVESEEGKGSTFSFSIPKRKNGVPPFHNE